MFGDTIKATLGLDTAGFQAELSRAHGSVSNFGSLIKGAFLGAGIEEFTRGIVEYGAHVYDLGKRFDVSTESIQRFGNAAEENGSSLESVARAFNKLEIASSRAIGGNSEIMDSFAALNITLDDLKRLSPDERLMKLAKSSMNAADMVKVLGKNALELRPLLEGLADGSIELGDAIENNTIKALKKADQTFSELWKNVRLLGGSTLGWISEQFGSLEGTLEKLGLPGAKHPDGGNEESAAAKRRAARVAAEEERSAEREASKRARDDLKERERLQFSLKELADREALPSNNQSLQAWWAGKQARDVIAGEARARVQAVDDLAGAQATLSISDQQRQGISGLRESEKQVGAFKEALGETNQLISTTNQILNSIEE